MRLRQYFFILAVCVVHDRVHAQHNIHASEYEVKAAFLYNFARFVEWPAQAIQDSTAPFIIGVLGLDPFGPILDQMAEMKTVKGKNLVIRRFRNCQDLTFCHLLFISNSEKMELIRIFEKIRGSRILTIGEMDYFLECRGMIQFIMKENRIHFSINVDAAEEAGLKLSSKLLNLAIHIMKKPVNVE